MSLAAYIGIGATRRTPADAGGRNVLARVWMGAALASTCLGLLGGCAITLPMASLIPNHHDDAGTTGTIPKPQLAGWLEGEDWRSAKPAFSRALDAQKSGVTTAWENPASGAKGTFVAVGQAYPGVSGHCRAFRAEIDRKATDDSLEGTACAGKSGDWHVTEVKPAKS